MMELYISPEEKERSRVVTLTDFRKGLLDETPYENRTPYSDRKKRALYYQVVFYSLGALFLMLSAVVFLRQPHWALCDLYLGYCWVLQGLIGSVAGFLGVVSVLLAMHVKADCEAILHIWHSAKKRLGRLYRSKLAACGASLFSPFLASDQRLHHLRASYLHRREDLMECQKKTATVLNQIASSKSLLVIEREQLLNEALWNSSKSLSIFYFSISRARMYTARGLKPDLPQLATYILAPAHPFIRGVMAGNEAKGLPLTSCQTR